MKKSFMFGFGLLLLSACTEVYFTEAQPEGRRAETQFPTAWQGTYAVIDEGEIKGDSLVINAKEMIGFSYKEIKLAKAEFDTMQGAERRGKFIVLTEGGESHKYRYQDLGDTLLLRRKEEEPLGLSDSLVYKSFKGKHFLSLKETGKKGWYVSEGAIDNGILRFKVIDADSIESLVASTHILELDTVKNEIANFILIAPSPKELMEIEEKGLFSVPYLEAKKVE